MTRSPLTVIPVEAPVQQAAFDLPGVVLTAVAAAGAALQDGDVLAVSSKYAAISEGRVVNMAQVEVTAPARHLAERYHMNPVMAQLVLQEADHVFGGIEGFLLTYKDGILSPNAGLDRSNIPSGWVVLFPARPYATARGLRAAARADYLANIEPPKVPGAVQMGEIMAWLNANLPEDAILTNGAGNYTVWLHRFFQYRRFRTQLAPTSGAMGYGVPAAVAAKALYPERQVISFAGDGCFLMNGQELATAVQYGLPVVFVVVNNGMYGTIRMHQEREYPGRTIGTDLANPDFAALARAYGALGETVETTDAFVPAFQRALAAKKPALIEIRLDPEALTPRASLTQIRETALKAKG